MANLPVKVVLPEPCKPDIRMIAGDPLVLMSTLVPPINKASSSCTILTINSLGFTDVSTSIPMALALTCSVKVFAVLKFTSASSNALRTSFSVSATLISVIFPCPFSILKDRSNLSLKLSNISIFFVFY